MKDGVITKEDYVELHAAYEARGKEAQEAAGKTERELRAVLKGDEDKYQWISYFKEYKDIGELTRQQESSRRKGACAHERSSYHTGTPLGTTQGQRAESGRTGTADKDFKICPCQL